jgi:DNA-binding transcriptional LysR family regulator
MQMDWDKLKSFHAAAETGSLTAAAERLGISQSAVSRQIAALEDGLGISVFQRHARGLVLTDAGHILHRSTRDMAAAAQSASFTLRDAQDHPSGELTVSAPVTFGSVWLTPKLGSFMDAYPDLRVNMRLDDGEFDLLKLEAECAIRLWAADKADLIQRRLGTVATSLYAAPEYLQAHGTPAEASDLDGHRIVVYGTDTNTPMRNVNWAQRVGRDDRPPRTPSLIINNVFAMLRAVEAGLGIADLPDYMVSPRSNLVKVLPELTGPAFELYFVYPSDLRRSSRIAAFRDFLTAQVAELKRASVGA